MANYSATFSNYISNLEISSNPAFGKVTGDTTPDGLLTKLANGHAQIAVDLDTGAAPDSIKTAFDGHDHDPLSSYPGGPPIGTGGVTSLATDSVTAAKIPAGTLQGAKFQNSSVTTATLAANSITSAKIGEPASRSFTLSASGSSTWTHGFGNFLLCHAECLDDGNAGDEVYVVQGDNNNVTVGRGSTGGASVSVTLRYIPGA